MLHNVYIKLFAAYGEGEVFVGFSGGADSTLALLLARNCWKPDRLTAVHFAHNLRGEESEREAREAEEFCSKHHIRFLRIDLAVSGEGGPEAAARTARLTEWKRLTAGKEAVVILGHHADDRVETLLLRLARGSNVSGLTAIRPVSIVGGVTFLRPLLDWRRAEIEEHLRNEYRIDSWAEDSSNDNDCFIRNFLRNKLLPDCYRGVPGSENGLLRSLAPLQEDAEFLEAEARRRFAETGKRTKTPFPFWRELHPAIQVRVFRLWLSGCYGHDVTPNRALLERFRKETARNLTGTRYLPLPEGKILRIRGTESVSFHKMPTASPGALRWNWRLEPSIRWSNFLLRAETTGMVSRPGLNQAYFDAELLPEELVIDRRRAGDRLLPFGWHKEMKLKKLRIDRGFPADFPNPVIRLADGTVIWAPGIRHSDYAKIAENSRQIVRFLLESEESETILPD